MDGIFSWGVGGGPGWNHSSHSSVAVAVNITILIVTETVCIYTFIQCDIIALACLYSNELLGREVFTNVNTNNIDIPAGSQPPPWGGHNKLVPCSQMSPPHPADGSWKQQLRCAANHGNGSV